MSANSGARRARPHPAVPGERTGRVVRVECGLVLVSTRSGVVRATVGADLLGRMASDPLAAPRVGDRVRLRTWPDGPVTVERVVARPLPDALS